MALWRVRTRWLVGYAAVASRSRNALPDQAAPVPDHPGKRLHQPTARGVCHGVVGMHWLGQAGQWPMGLNRTAAPHPLLRLLGPPYRWFDDVTYSSTSRGGCGRSGAHSVCHFLTAKCSHRGPTYKQGERPYVWRTMPLVQTSLVGALDIRPASMAGVWDGACADLGLAMLLLSRPSRHWREGDEPHSGAHGFLRTVAGGGPVWH